MGRAGRAPGEADHSEVATRVLVITAGEARDSAGRGSVCCGGR